MRDLILGASIFALAALAALAVHPPSNPASQQPVAIEAGTTCETKHCPANTHCCPGCNGGVICLKGGVHCPECAPQ